MKIHTCLLQSASIFSILSHPCSSIDRGGGGTHYNGLYGAAPPERGNFVRLQVNKREGISQVEVYKRERKSVTSQRELNKQHLTFA